MMCESAFTSRIALLKLLTGRLERLSVDSIWARRASGLRGSLIKALDLIETGPGITIEHLDMLIENSFEILKRAAHEIPDSEEQLRKFNRIL